MKSIDVKRDFKKYICWLNTTPNSITSEQKTAVRELISFWRSYNGGLSGVNGLYEIKEFHANINGCSGNEELWNQYLKSAMSLRILHSSRILT